MRLADTPRVGWPARADAPPLRPNGGDACLGGRRGRECDEGIAGAVGAPAHHRCRLLVVLPQELPCIIGALHQLAERSRPLAAAIVPREVEERLRGEIWGDTGRYGEIVPRELEERLPVPVDW